MIFPKAKRQGRRRRRARIPWFKTYGWGTVYLLQSRADPALFKVGYTHRKTKTRRGELNRMVAGGLVIRFTVTLPHAYVVEQRVLRGLRNRWFGRRDHRGTEWFHLRRSETIDDIATRIMRASRAVEREARLKLSWKRGTQIRTFSTIINKATQEGTLHGAEYRWFCKLDLSDPIPDHSTFSKNRHGRFRDSNLFRHLFEAVVARCMAEGLVGGEIFATDASIIQADANKQYSAPKADWDTAQIDPAAVPRAVREYIETLDDAAFGAASEVAPKFTSFSDPASQWTGALKGPAFFAYSTNYLIDTDHAIILDVEATRAIRQAEVGATQTMLTRTHDRFDLSPDRLAADTAYGSGNMLGWLVDQDIEPHVPVIDRSDRKDGTFSNLDFSYDPATGEYTCPGGNPLKKYWRKMRTARTGVSKDGIKRYYASKKHCSTCALKEQCVPNKDARIVARHVHEAARDKARQIAKTDAYADASRRRKKVEMLFAHLKKIMRLDRLRLRGPNGAKDEFLLAATAQNLRKLAKLRPMGPAMT